MDVLPFVSVVVPVYNGATSIAACLQSLQRQTYPHECYEIIVVDDGSTDATAEVIEGLSNGWSGTLRIVRKPNGGPASARNVGIRASAAEIVAFTDADCVAESTWLAALVETLIDSAADGVGGPIANPTDARWVTRFLTATQFYRHRVRDGRVDYLLTANLAVRRAALQAVGGFSEIAGAWGEDADLSFRLMQSGYMLLLAKRGSVTHLGSPASVRGLVKELYRYGRGNYVLSRHWHNGRTPTRELIRHCGAAVLAPVLMLRCARRVGPWWALTFWPLFVIEHTAFAAGIVRGMVKDGRGW